MLDIEINEESVEGYVVERTDHRQQRLVGQDAEAALSALTLYRSGATNRSDFLGYARNNEPMGVVVTQLSAPVERALIAHASAGGRIFIDSGVYSASASREVDFEEVMSRYERIARATQAPGNLLMVMPDKIGDHDATVRLLAQWRARIEGLIAIGVDIIVPLQRSAHDIVSAYDQLVEALGTRHWRIGLPCKACAHPNEDLLRLGEQRQFARAHLLGVGADQRKLYRIVAALRQNGARPDITADSCRLRSMVGQGRPLTVLTRYIETKTDAALEAIATAERRLWPDLNALMAAIEAFADTFGYADDITDLVGELSMGGGFAPEELRWLARRMSIGASEAEIDLIARIWGEDGLVFEELEEIGKQLTAQRRGARAMAVGLIARIEQSGGRIVRDTQQRAVPPGHTPAVRHNPHQGALFA